MLISMSLTVSTSLIVWRCDWISLLYSDCLPPGGGGPILLSLVAMTFGGASVGVDGSAAKAITSGLVAGIPRAGVRVASLKPIPMPNRTTAVTPRVKMDDRRSFFGKPVSLPPSHWNALLQFGLLGLSPLLR
jgi:hypothetical protein